MSTQFTKSAHSTKWIPIKNLSVIWANAQREFDPKHASRIAAEFDPDMFDDLVVTLPNGDGIYHVVDGQHRKAALQSLYGDDEQLPCRVVNAEDPARAADIFNKINTSRKAPNAVDRFNVRVTAGYETEVAVARIATFLGYKINKSRSDGSIGSVNALVSVYKSFGSEVLKDTLMTIKATWGQDFHAYEASIIRGYGAFIAQFRSKIDWTRLRQQVSKAYTPGRLLGAAKTGREMFGGSMADGVKQVLIATYNKGLRNGKLEDHAGPT
jgi:hypothetical protein